MGILRNTIDDDGLTPQAALDSSSGLGSAPTLAAPPVPMPGSTPPVPPIPPPAVPASPTSSSGAGARSDLRRRRDTLAEQVTELHWDLGGLAYEMAIRDHFRLDVLVRRAALLQERDAELAEVERLLRMEQDGVAGSCPACSAPHSRGALYCWQCGTTLMERLPSSAAISEQ
jgi:hypothetical protein